MELANSAFPFLAEPLPDEILISVIARSAWQSGETLAGFVGRRNPNYQINSFIYKFLDRFDHLDKALERSVYPYYFSCLSEKKRAAVIESLKNGLSGSEMLPDKTLKPLKKNHLFYCPKCLQEDLIQFGLGYFHLRHQYEGVKACQKHGLVLSEFKEAPRPLTEKDLTEPETAGSDETRIARIICDTVGLDFKTAGKCYQNIIDGMEERTPRLQEKAFIDRVNSGNPNSPVFLTQKRLKSLVGKRERNAHPYFHALIWNAFGIDRNSVRNPENFKTEKETPGCRNPYCISTKTVQLGYSNTGNHFYRCLECGQIFSEKSILQLGKTGKEILLARKEAEKGFMGKTVEKMGLSKMTLRKLLKQDGNSEEKKILEKREEAVEFSSLNELKSTNHSLYLYLKKLDYKWLKEQFPEKDKNHPVFLSESEKEIKDQKYLEMLVDARKRGMIEDFRVTATWLLREAGYKGNLKDFERYYPQSGKFIRENAESPEDSWIRRVRLYIDRSEDPANITAAEIRKNVSGSRYALKAFRLLNNYRKEKCHEI